MYDILNDVAFFLGGLLLGCLLTMSLAFPSVGRAVAKVVAVILLGLGVGFLVWASVAAYRGERTGVYFDSSHNIATEVSEAFGWGAGFSLCGILALVLALRHRRADKDPVVRVERAAAPDLVRK